MPLTSSRNRDMKLLRQLLLVCAFVSLSSISLHAQNPEAKAIIDRAIKAVGGAEKIASFPAGKVKASGKFFMGPQTVEFKQESSHQLPDMIRERSEFTQDGKKVIVEMLYDGSIPVILMDGKPVEANKLAAYKKSMSQSVHLMNVSRFITLSDPKYKLSVLEERQIEGKNCQGVKVDADGQEPIKIYFDKATGLPVSMELNKFDPNKETSVLEERRLVEFMDVNGIKVAKKAKLLQNGNVQVELTVNEVEYVKSLDKTIFKKP